MRRWIAATAIALCLAAAGPAVAQDTVTDYFDHNGSIMAWNVTDHAVRVTYQTPRAGLDAVGIRPGTVLFEGRAVPFEEILRLEGTAYVFKRGCVPAPYAVRGEDVGDDIVLSGAAPLRAEGCTVTGYSEDSGNAKLNFVFLPAGPPAQAPAAAR